MLNTYSAIRVSCQNGVAHVSIDNPPVNVLDVQLMTELTDFLESTREDSNIRVIIFDSADPEFFIAHVDMSLIDEPHAFDALAAKAASGLNPFQAFAETLRHQPQVTIVKLAGMARGGGAEFVAAVDMSFAAIGRGALAQCEALMGIVPGGAGTQYLSHQVGRSRALEIVLGADLFDAHTAERYGWINRAVPADEMDTFVDQLAEHIAELPEGVIEGAKHAIPPQHLTDGLAREHDAWAALFARPAAETLIRAGLANGAQTRDGERQLETILRNIKL